MKIEVTEGGRRVMTLRIPSLLVFNPIGAAIISRTAKAADMPDTAVLGAIFRELRRCKRRHHNFVFIEIEEKSGDDVRIYL